MRRCRDHRCGVLWLDPMPAEDDLGKLYTDYYTHEEIRAGLTPKSAKLVERLRNAYCAERYGYLAQSNSSTFGLRHLAYALPGHRAQWNFSVFYLPAQLNGRLLEIGCGNGAMLSRMANLGWQVVGIDFDSKAVKVARSEGLDVRRGTLDEQNFDDSSFDAVVMSHVIEHVTDPSSLLRNCNRILKPGGRLIAITPNALSWGHGLYARDWRGLEPPRHLHVFTIPALQTLLESCGFPQPEVCSVIANAHWILWGSSKLKHNGRVPLGSTISTPEKLWSRGMQLMEHLLMHFRRESGEEILARAVKE